MNILEAIAAMREGKKVKGKEWFDGYYCFYDNEDDNFFLNDPETEYIKVLTVEEFTDLFSFNSVEKLESLEYEIYESEEDKLIKKGKLLDIAMFCDELSFINNKCEESCPIRMFCPQVGNVKRMIMGNEKIKNSDIEAMYKAIKKYRGV